MGTARALLRVGSDDAAAAAAAATFFRAATAFFPIGFPNPTAAFATPIAFIRPALTAVLGARFGSYSLKFSAPGALQALELCEEWGWASARDTQS